MSDVPSSSSSVRSRLVGIKFHHAGTIYPYTPGGLDLNPGEKQCIWVQAYDRLKVFKEQDYLEDHIAPPCNWTLWQTPSWLNFYLGRDHTAKRLGIQPYRRLTRAEKREARKQARTQSAGQGDQRD